MLEKYLFYYDLPIFLYCFSNFLRHNVNIIKCLEIFSKIEHPFGKFCKNVLSKLKKGFDWRTSIRSSKYNLKELEKFYIIFEQIYYYSSKESADILENLAKNYEIQIKSEIKERIKKVSAFTYMYVSFVTLAPTLCLILSSMSSLIEIQISSEISYLILIISTILYLTLIFVNCPYLLTNLLNFSLKGLRYVYLKFK